MDVAQRGMSLEIAAPSRIRFKNSSEHDLWGVINWQLMAFLKSLMEGDFTLL
jgi:hypothetical protein